MEKAGFDVTASVGDEMVLVRDVGPRDGLQAIDQEVPLDTKIAMTNGLVAAGVLRVEAGSFVSPKAVPRHGGLPPSFRRDARRRLARPSSSTSEVRTPRSRQVWMCWSA